MPVRLAGYQPQYFPRLHYFARILDADIFKISDYVQFVRAHTYLRPDGTKERGPSYQAHTPIKTGNGLYVLTIPTVHHGLTPLNRTAIQYASDWPHKHYKTIFYAYGRAKHASAIMPQLKELLSTEYGDLASLNTATILWSLAWTLGEHECSVKDLSVERVNLWLNTKPHPFRLRKIAIVSQTNIPPRGDGRNQTDWIIDSCQRLGAHEYYHGGTAAAAYLDLDRLIRAGIRPIQQQWSCQPYQQLHGQNGFIPNLSIIDLVMNEDRQRVWEILRG